MAVSMLEQLEQHERKPVGGEKAAGVQSSQSSGIENEGADTTRHAHVYESDGHEYEFNAVEPLASETPDHQRLGAACEGSRGTDSSVDDNKGQGHADVNSCEDGAQGARVISNPVENGYSSHTVPPSIPHGSADRRGSTSPSDHLAASSATTGMEDTGSASASDESVDVLTFRAPDLRMPRLGEAAIGVGSVWESTG